MRAKAPNLDGTIQTGRRKSVAILGIKLDLHDIVRMPFEHLSAIKATIPIPQLDGHIVRRREHVGKRRMDFQGTNVICMSFKFLDFLHCVIVEDTETHIVGGCNEPLFSRDEFGASDGELREFKGLDANATFVIPNHDITTVECCQNPWLRRVNVY